MPPSLIRIAVALLVVTSAHPNAQRAVAPGEWRHHGGDAGSTKYAPLDQITAANVASLQMVWRRPAVDPASPPAHPKLVVPGNFRATPLKAGDLLFASNALGLAEAFDPATGRTVWAQAVAADDLGGAGASRNLAYWAAQWRRARLQRARRAICTRSTPAAGGPSTTFGVGGRVDLAGRPRRQGHLVPLGRARAAGGGRRRHHRRPGLDRQRHAGATCRPATSAPTTCAPGTLRWTFHVVPRPGEPGIETWERDSWSDTGSAKAWSLMSADEELGLRLRAAQQRRQRVVRRRSAPAPISTPTAWCASTPRTGERKWHFQMVHHDLWDYDNPTAPVLADITVERPPRSRRSCR